MKLNEGAPPASEPSTFLARVPDSARLQTRTIKWISIGEFISLFEERSDLVVFDLRATAQWAPFPIPNAFVLSVNPKELATLLEWLPPDRSVVFYGASSLSIFMIETSGCMAGSAPLYVLEGNLNLAEAA